MDQFGAGPLEGTRILEMEAMGAVPHAALLLSDLGAEVVRVCRPGGAHPSGDFAQERDLLLAGRRSVSADLRDTDDLARVRRLLSSADVLIEGFRPGVMERLGLGPSEVRELNPRLIYVRVTGWGQQGPRSSEPGHDINYLSMTGALHAMGDPAGAPLPPLNLVANFGGGSMFAVTSVLAALIERGQSGEGQVIDVAMTDGVSVLSQSVWSMKHNRTWRDERGANLLDGSCPFYSVYPCADGGYFAVGAIEPAFYANLLGVLGLADEELPDQWDRAGWPRLREVLGGAFRRASREEWRERFVGVDACATPVLSYAEAPDDPHHRARGAYVRIEDQLQPAPSPRLHSAPLRRTGSYQMKLDDVVGAWNV